MDPEFSSMSTSTIESIRKAGIGRRGGVKVRGGRLPPVKIHSVLSKKKTIAPKIPQKRSEAKKEKIDKEAFDQLLFRDDAKFRHQRQRDSRGRGRGRGARVYIQTEGTLFGDGMACKSKSGRNYSSYDKVSVPRSKISSKAEKKVKSEEIGYLLESFDYSEEESDMENDLKPVKYPQVKEKQEIKKEIKQEIQQEIKQEIEEEIKKEVDQFCVTEEIVKSIKVEPVDDYEEEEKPSVSKFFTPIKAVTFTTENELVTDLNTLQNDEGIMLLLQLPSCFPFDKRGDGDGKTSENKHQTSSTLKDKNKDENPDEEIRIKSSIQDMPEGFIGKLQFLKSGKIRLVMGSIQFYLETGSERQVVAHAVSIAMDGKEGDLMVLGNIERKMLLRPHFNGITD